MGKIAPHINKEISFILSGLKPLATIEKRKDAIGYALAISLVNAGTLAGKIVKSIDSPEGEIILTQKVNKNLIDKYLYLLENGIQELGIKEYHYQMGKLFGYSDDDILAFLNAEIHCDCTKCKGFKK